LTKVLIGNGLTDAYSMMEAYYTYACTTIPFMDGPVDTIGSCVSMAKKCVIHLAVSLSRITGNRVSAELKVFCESLFPACHTAKSRSRPSV
jgi:hypothetical protein